MIVLPIWFIPPHTPSGSKITITVRAPNGSSPVKATVLGYDGNDVCLEISDKTIAARMAAW